MAIAGSVLRKFVELTKEPDISTGYYVYGTAIVNSDGKYVQVDGSDSLTSVSIATDIVTNDRVLVYIEGHKASVIGNVTCPASGRTAVDVSDMLEDFSSLVVGALYATYAEIESIRANYVTTEYLEATYATITDLKVVFESVDYLYAGVANIETLLGGEGGFGELESIHLSAGNAVIDQAVIVNAVAGTIMADLILSDFINTDLIKIGSTDGTLWIDGSTILIIDTNDNPRIQIGLDNLGDYNLALWDEDGNCMWNAAGVTEYGVNDGVIRDEMVAADAAIQGSKLDIESICSIINENGDYVISAGSVKIDDESLDAWYTQITQQVEGLEGLSTENLRNLEPWFCLWNSDTEVPPDDAGLWVDYDIPVTEEMYKWVKWLGTYNDGHTEWSTPYCLTDGYLRTTTSVLQTELIVVQGQIEAYVWETETALNGLEESVKDTWAVIEISIGEILQTVGDMETTLYGADGSVGLTTQVSLIEQTADSISESVNSVVSWLGDGYSSSLSLDTCINQYVDDASANILLEVSYSYATIGEAVKSVVNYYAIGTSPEEPPWQEQTFIETYTISSGSFVYPEFDVSPGATVTDWSVDNKNVIVSEEPHVNEKYNTIEATIQNKTSETQTVTLTVVVSYEGVGWSPDYPTVPDGYYLWVCQYITYVDGHTELTEPFCVTDDIDLTGFATIVETNALIEASAKETEASILSTVSGEYVSAEDHRETTATIYEYINDTRSEIIIEANNAYESAKEYTDAQIKVVATETESSILSQVSYAYSAKDETVKAIQNYYCLSDNFWSPGGVYVSEDFSSGSTPSGWGRSNSSVVTFGSSDILGSYARICPSSGSAYLYVNSVIGTLSAGKYILRFKAATEAGYESTAEVQIRFPSSGSSYARTFSDLKSDEWTQFELEYELTSDTRSYLYFYNTIKNVPILITDVIFYGDDGSWGTVLPTVPDGYYLWVRQFITYADGTTEWIEPFCVTDDLSNYPTLKVMTASIEEYVDESMAQITLSVSGGLGVGTASIILTAGSNSLGSGEIDLSQIRKAFENDNTAITISGNAITFISNSLVVSSTQFELDINGNATFSGTLSAPGGEIGGWTIATSGLISSYASVTPSLLTYGDNFEVDSSGHCIAKQFDAVNSVRLWANGYNTAGELIEIEPRKDRGGWVAFLDYNSSGSSTLIGAITRYASDQYEFDCNGLNLFCYGESSSTPSFVAIGDYDEWRYIMNSGLDPWGYTQRHIFRGNAVFARYSSSEAGNVTIEGTLTVGDSTVATQDWVSNQLSGSGSSTGGYVTQSDLTADLSNYALKSDIPDVSGFITASALDGYIKSGDSLSVTFVGTSGQLQFNTSYSNSYTFNIASLLQDASVSGDITCDNVYTCENISTGVMGVYVGGPVASSFSMGLVWANDVDTRTYGGLGFFYPYHAGADASPSGNNLFCYVDVTFSQGCYFGYNPDSAWYGQCTTTIQGQNIRIGNPNGGGTIYIGLDSEADIRFTGSRIVFNSSVIHSSDARLKTSIQPLNTSSLDNLIPVSFKWRDGDDKTHYGYIAQEVRPYFPELVSEGTDGMLGLAYTEIIPLLHLEIKQLKEQIKQLQKGATQ